MRTHVGCADAMRASLPAASASDLCTKSCLTQFCVPGGSWAPRPQCLPRHRDPAQRRAPADGRPRTTPKHAGPVLLHAIAPPATAPPQPCQRRPPAKVSADAPAAASTSPPRIAPGRCHPWGTSISSRPPRQRPSKRAPGQRHPAEKRSPPATLPHQRRPSNHAAGRCQPPETLTSLQSTRPPAVPGTSAAAQLRGDAQDARPAGCPQDGIAL